MLPLRASAQATSFKLLGLYRTSLALQTRGGYLFSTTFYVSVSASSIVSTTISEFSVGTSTNSTYARLPRWFCRSDARFSKVNLSFSSKKAQTQTTLRRLSRQIYGFIVAPFIAPETLWFGRNWSLSVKTVSKHLPRRKSYTFGNTVFSKKYISNLAVIWHTC